MKELNTIAAIRERSKLKQRNNNLKQKPLYKSFIQISYCTKTILQNRRALFLKSTEKWNIGLIWVNAEKFLQLDTISTSKNKELHCYNYDYFEVDKHTLRKKCLYSELFWSVFSRIRTEYGEIRSISPYSVQMLETTDQSNSEYGHFLRNVVMINASLNFDSQKMSFTSLQKLWIYLKK